MDRAIELLSLYREDIDATQIAEILWLSQYINITPNKKPINPIPSDNTKNNTPLPPKKNSDFKFNEVQYTILINSYKGTFNDSGEDFGFERNNNTSYSVGFTQVDNFPNILKQFESLRFKEKKLDKNILDEEKTADKIALIGFFHPIFQEVQNRENYFDLNIIIDESKSMFLWKEHIKHFIKSIRLSSVFNYINIIHLDSSEDKALFKDEKSNNLRFDAPLFKRDRRLTLIFTDVVGKAWRTNHMFTVIDSWSKYSFVSIVSMLPNHMWQKTPLRQGVNAFMKSNKVLPKNKDLKLEYNFIERKIGSVNTKIPVISYDDSSFFNLSNIITAKKDSWIDARIFGELKTKSLKEKLPLNISAEERVERFFASSLPETRKLAIYCSVLPLHKRVIEKLIREKSLGQGMNAFVEFYFGGLLDRDAKVNSDEYKFYEGVRRELISYISVEGIESLFKLLNDVISQSLGLNISIVDLLYADSSTLNNLGKKEKNIANFLIDILKEKGKYFKKQVDTLTNMAQKKSINFSMIQVSEVNLEIGKNLVSTEEYNLFCEDTKRKIVSSDLDKDTQPIINISWNDAQSYCIWLSKKLGEKYRLPSKSEREYFSKKIDFLEDTNDNISEWCEEKVFWSSSKKKSDIGFRVIKEFKTIGGVSNSLSIEELKTIILQEENEKLEFKTRWNQPVQNLVKYILSLTNGSPKHIDKTAYFIIGIDERDKNSFKLKKDEVLVIFSELQELLNEYTKPEITGLLIEWYNLEEDNGVLVISIPPQNHLLSLCKDLNLKTNKKIDRKGTIYYRVNDNIRIASDKIIKKFIQAYGIILLYKEDDLDVDLLKLVQYLNDVCEYLTFEVGKESFTLKDKKVSWSESYKNLNSAIHEETKYSKGAFFFTKKTYNNNYFFEGNTAFPNLMIVSFSGWSSLSSLPYSNAIAYFVAEILSLDLSSFQHQDSTGCLYDFSSNKADIDKNMREAYICKDCYSRIEDNKSDINMKVLKDIESILEVVGSASSNDLDILEYRNNPNKNNILSVKELEKIILQGEGAKVEFKREWYRKDYLNEFVKDFFSLANGDIYTVKDTAYLIIGIDDRKEIYDFDKSDISSLDEFKKMLFYKLNSYAEFHTIDFKIEWYKIENKKILVISIPPQNKLICLSTDMKLRNRIDRKGTTYYRVGEDIRVASTDVINDFEKAFNPKPQINLPQKKDPKHLTSLPPINTKFIGREADLKEIEKNLNSDNVVCVVNGIGGVGKSELSYKYLHDNKAKYNKIAFIEFTEESRSLEETFYFKFQDTFQLTEKDTLDTIIKKLQGFAPKNLMVLDNLQSNEDFNKVKALTTNFDLLITTRAKFDSPNILNLESLNDGDMRELFLSIYPTDENIDSILKYLDNHPLFITLTAYSLKEEYIDLDELRADIASGTVTKIDSKDDKTFQEHLHDTFDRQFKNEQNSELKEILQILALFPAIEIEFEMLKQIIADNKLKVKLQKLVARGWLSKKDNSYKLHQIIKTFILTSYPAEYEDVTFILENIGKCINPDNGILKTLQLNEKLAEETCNQIVIELFEKCNLIEEQHANQFTYYPDKAIYFSKLIHMMDNNLFNQFVIDSRKKIKVNNYEIDVYFFIELLSEFSSPNLKEINNIIKLSSDLNFEENTTPINDLSSLINQYLENRFKSSVEDEIDNLNYSDDIELVQDYSPFFDQEIIEVSHPINIEKILDKLIEELNVSTLYNLDKYQILESIEDDFIKNRIIENARDYGHPFFDDDNDEFLY